MKRSILFALSIALLGACSTKEKDILTPVQDDVVFYASFEQPVEEGTRVYANEDLLLRWTADDRVGIFNKLTYNQEYIFTGQTGANAGGFKKVDNDEFVTGNPISHVVSVYPYQEATTITEEEVISLTLPAEQEFVENTFGLGANTMVSVSENNVLQYKNVGGFLRISLYGAGVSVSSITLKGNDDEMLAGKATVRMPLDGEPSVVMASDAVKEITLLCDSPVTLSANAEDCKDFWFVVPPMTFDRGFTISVNQISGGVFEKSTSKSITIERSRLTKMSPMEVESATPPVYVSKISIDGDFSDWAKLDASKISVAECAPGAFHTALKLVKVYADLSYVFIYFEWDTNQINPNKDKEHVPLDCYINVDGDATTGGYGGFSDRCTDIILEGYLYPDGELGSYDPKAFAWTGGTNSDSWSWSADLGGKNLCQGAGIDGKYEFLIDRAAFATMGIPIADEFSIGFELMESWTAVGRLPNTTPSEGHPNDIAPSLQVITNRNKGIPIPEAIDLGLPSGIKWASFNLGASTPEEYGDYYAWGETGPKEIYSWETYKWCMGSDVTMTKYCQIAIYGYEGFTDGKTVLDPEDDAACMVLGGKWRMPTDAEWNELRETCTWKWTTQKGVNGRLGTGPNGNSIFFPAAGLRYSTYLEDLVGTRGYYWTSSLISDSPYRARRGDLGSGMVSWSYGDRYYGQSIRSVCD